MEIKSVQNFLGVYSRPSVPPEHFVDNLINDYNGSKQAWNYLTKDRKLKSETLEHFKIGLSENKEVSIPVFKNGDLIDYKFRTIPPADKGFRRHTGAETWCFNETALEECHKEGYLIVTEGEMDAMSLWQLGFINVVSVSSGAQGSTPWVNKIPDNVKVYICFDNDEPGKDAADKLSERIGIERCYNVIIPECKDANEFLVKGGINSDFQILLDNAAKFKIKDVFKVSEIFDRLKNNRLDRIQTFSEKLTSHLNGGIPNQSLVTISGRTGQGKSTLLLNLLVGHADEGRPVLLVSLENDLYFTIQRILEIRYKKVYSEFTKKDWKTIYEEMADYPFYIDTSMETYTMDKIEKVVDQAKKTLGIQFFGFDHIGFIPSRDDAKEISQMVREFKLLARKYNIIVYMVSHVRKAMNINDYLSSEELKGAASIGQDSDIVLFIVGTRAGHEISIDKARMSRSKLRIPIIFNGDMGIITDDPSRDVKQYDQAVEDPVKQEVKVIEY